MQTLWGRLVGHSPPVPLRAWELATPDGDFLELVRVDAPADRPRLLLLHGLEGSVDSHYARGTLAQAAARGWGADLLHFRGCGTRPNRAARFYHSGETGDLAFVLDALMREFPLAPITLVGFSLGGNVLLKWLGEQGSAAPVAVRGAAAVSVPFDLERGARHLQHGFARVYDRHFLRTLKVKAREKLGRHPGLFDIERLANARTLRDFDDAVTGPVHGFADAAEYYRKSSSIHFLRTIAVPTLLLSAVDDPFLPQDVLDQVREVAQDNPALSLEFVERGGHVGFVGGPNPFKPVWYAEERTVQFLAGCISTLPTARAG